MVPASTSQVSLPSHTGEIVLSIRRRLFSSRLNKKQIPNSEIETIEET